jgi:hypothetical protein
MSCQCIDKDGQCTSKTKSKSKSKSKFKAKPKPKVKAKARPEPVNIPELEAEAKPPEAVNHLLTIPSELEYNIINYLSLQDVLSMRATSSNNDVANYILKRRHADIYPHASDVSIKIVIQDLIRPIKALKRLVHTHLYDTTGGLIVWDHHVNVNYRTVPMNDIDEDIFVNQFVNAHTLRIYNHYDFAEIEIKGPDDMSSKYYLTGEWYSVKIFEWLKIYIQHMVHLQYLSLTVQRRISHHRIGRYISVAPRLTTLEIEHIMGLNPDNIPNVTTLLLEDYDRTHAMLGSSFPAVIYLYIETIEMYPIANPDVPNAYLDINDITADTIITNFPNVKSIQIGTIIEGDADILINDLQHRGIIVKIEYIVHD